MLLKPAIQSAGFHPGGGGGGGGEASPPPSPKKERENEEKRKRRERERDREKERCMVGGKGERVYFCVALQVISIVSYFMTQLFKSTR